MADIRIKDITTTASSTASGDFFVIDGTTGTRKVNAFNPSFGGNATVTGTLTVNSTSSFVGNATLQGSALWLNDGGGGTFNFVNGSTVANTLRLGIGNTNQVLITDTKTTILATTASTTTSSGALVVSGGVGIAKALFTGESTYLAGAVGSVDAAIKNGFGRSANGNSYLDLVGDTTYTDYGLRMIRGGAGANADSEIVHRGTGVFRITTNEAASLVLRTAATAALTIASDQTATFSGRLAVGATALSDRMFYVSGSTGTTGASQFAAVVNPTIPNTVTTGAYGLYLGTNIAAGATVTNGYSLFIAAPDYTGSTVTNKYGLYSNDPNPSYFVGRVLIDNSTPSTTTSTGALVVSGGVGVAGAVNAGGTITSTNASGSGLLGMRSSSGNASYVFWSETGVADRGILGFNNGSSTLSYRSFSSSFSTGTEVFSITSAGVVSIPATTASTSTSSGALVVSGGVGVAGAIYAGGNIRVKGSAFTTRLRQDAAVLDFVNTAESGYESATILANTLSLYGNSGTGLVIGTTGNATFAGNITTAAPAGGTAAAWKLGTVASVSPTSPNRTIEVDIGGTIYYIHAKTTNN